jgi:protein-disulfide isomerase
MKPHAGFKLAEPINAVDHVLGPSHAPVSVVEYGDFECPGCKQAAPVVHLLLERFVGRVRVAFRHYPLEEFHPHALLAAQAAECAGAQNKFWEMHDLLFDNQQHLQRQHLQSYAERLDLDMKRFNAELGDEIYLQRIREHIESGDRSGVRATPSFYINDEIHDVTFNLHELIDSVEAALRKV